MIDLPPGTSLKQGQYQIQQTLGRGGFGITYKGIFSSYQMPIAIKENWPDSGIRSGTNINWTNLPPKKLREQLEKFLQEAYYLSQCIHSNIAKVYDYFEENNTAYIVMEFIQGESLHNKQQYLKQQQKEFAEEEVIDYGLQIASGLQIVHGQNLIHRDIKPMNIIITPENKAILIDFGAAREYVAHCTGRMTAILTSGYAPYEQYNSFDTRGPGTDIYALCATMYDLLTGDPPREATARYPQDTLIPPRYLRPTITPQLEQIILTGLQRELKDRFPTALDFINALSTLNNVELKGKLILHKNNISYTLNPQGSIIGRYDAQVSPSVTINLENLPNSDTISRLHGRIYRDGNQWKIQDNNSVNGIFIKRYGQSQFSPKITTVQNLYSGDEIAFGKVRFLFQTF